MQEYENIEEPEAQAAEGRETQGKAGIHESSRIALVLAWLIHMHKDSSANGWCN
jgi:hypothetical protein